MIRGKWTKQEKWFHGHLKGRKIKHKMHPKIDGSPDIIIFQKKIALFLHGCFWHGCKECYKEPRSNVKFWRDKVGNNMKRDKKNIRKLRKNGWVVRTIWECEVPRHNPSPSIREIINGLNA